MKWVKPLNPKVGCFGGGFGHPPRSPARLVGEPSERASALIGYRGGRERKDQCLCVYARSAFGGAHQTTPRKLHRLHRCEKLSLRVVLLVQDTIGKTDLGTQMRAHVAVYHPPPLAFSTFYVK